MSPFPTTQRFARPMLMTGLLLAIGLIALYPDLLFGTRTMFYRDFGFFGYPLAWHHREAFWEGRVPLWNPYNNAGLPFLAQWNTLVLYPGSLFYLLLPMPWALNLFCLGHLWLGGLGMFCLAGRWVGFNASASMAAVGYAFSGLLLHSLMWPNNIAAFGWLPWVILSCEAWLKSGGRRRFTVAVILSSLQMLAGAPEIILFTWVINAALLFADSWRTLARRMGRLSVVALAVILVCAVQLLPFLQLLSLSHRSEPFERDYSSLPWHGIGNLVLPLFRTTAESSGIHLPQGQNWTSSYYLGTIGMVLACGAAIGDRSRRVRVLGLLVFACLLLSFGAKGILLPFLERVFPPLSIIRFPVKYVIPLVVAVPLLASFGLRALLTSSSPRLRPAFLVLVGLVAGSIVGLLCFVKAYPRGEDWSAVLWNGTLRLLFLGIAAGLLVRIATRRNTPAAGIAQGCLVVVVAADLLSHMPRANPTAEPWVLAPLLRSSGEMQPVPELGKLRAMTSFSATLRHYERLISNPQNDFLVKRLVLLGSCNLLDRVPVYHGFFSLYLRREENIAAIVRGLPDLRSSPLLDFLSIGQVTPPGKDQGWERRPTTMAWITGGQTGRNAPPEELAQRLTSASFRPALEFFLPHVPAEERIGGQPVEVEDLRFEEENVSCVVRSQGGGWVVISQTFYPCWRASLDEKDWRIERANHAYQAVWVPGGEHRLRLRYVDALFLAGLAVAWLTTLGMVLGIRGGDGEAKKRARREAGL